MATLAQYQTWLAEAELKRHELRVNSALSRVTISSVDKTYDLPGLDKYIQELKANINALTPKARMRFADFGGFR